MAKAIEPPIGSVRVLIWAMVSLGALVLLTLGVFEVSALRAGGQAEGLIENTLPSSERLARMRTDLRSLDAALDDAIVALAEHREPGLNEIARGRAELGFTVDSYAQLPRSADGAPYLERIQAANRHLDDVLAPLVADLARGEFEKAASLDDGDWRRASDAFDAQVRDTVLFTIQHSFHHATVIHLLSRNFFWVSNVMLLVLFLLGVAATVIAATAVNRQVRHEQARAAELELFAGRVAHDLLSPLNGANITFQLLDRSLDPKVKQMARSGLSSIAHVSQVIDGLLRFAATGGRADLSARTPAREAVAAAVEELKAQAQEAKVELSCGRVPERELACRPEVVSVILSNLVRNSIKFMGDAERRQIALSVSEQAGFLRFEVADTGPGLAPGLEKTVFEAYVRGRTNQSGLGLGLATVKRLVEAHGAQVGVGPTPGGGATFWFTLPVAGVGLDAPAHETP